MVATDKKYGVFISYSHEDTKLIAPVVALIRSMRKDLVFQDYADIQPGKRWQPQLNTALEEAELIIVFWCNHAAESSYVKKEFQFAINKDKDVLPVLLDDCTLDNELANYQWIDFKSIITHRTEVKVMADRSEVGAYPSEETRKVPLPAHPEVARGRSLAPAILYLTVFIGVITFLLIHFEIKLYIFNFLRIAFYILAGAVCLGSALIIINRTIRFTQKLRRKRLDKSTDAVSMKPGKISEPAKESSNLSKESIVMAEEIRKQLDKKLPPDKQDAIFINGSSGV